MRSYDEKVEALKKKIEDKIYVYKAICKTRLEKSHFEKEEYIAEYHYLILLEQYIKRPDAFKERIGKITRRLDDDRINKLLGVNYDVVWNYLNLMDFKYKNVDMIFLFNHDIFTIKDFSCSNKWHL